MLGNEIPTVLALIVDICNRILGLNAIVPTFTEKKNEFRFHEPVRCASRRAPSFHAPDSISVPAERHRSESRFSSSTYTVTHYELDSSVEGVARVLHPR